MQNSKIAYLRTTLVATKEWRKVKSADAGICIRFLAAEIIQVLDSIARVRCASGNVSNLKIAICHL